MNSPRIAMAMLQAGHGPAPYRQRGVQRAWYTVLYAAVQRRWALKKRMGP